MKFPIVEVPQLLKKMQTGILAGTCLLGAASGAMAGSSNHYISIDGWVSDSGTKEIESGQQYTAAWVYDGSYKDCTRVKSWKINNSSLGSGSSSVSIQKSQPGDYDLTLTTEGYDGRWFFNLFGCNQSGQQAQTTVTLRVPDDLYTNTKYPIMLIPGVFGYDSTEYLVDHQYFYGVADAIRENSNQEVVDVSLDPWLQTEKRGLQLANRIITYLGSKDPDNFATANGMKVNLIAHSHGSTTARVALKILADQFPDVSLVASLTTVAGPHYGTPTAEGSQWVLDNWEYTNQTFFGDGKTFVESLMFLMGDVATLGLNLLTGDGWMPNLYGLDGIQEVVADFTQRGMARFNTCYPSAGLPNSQDASYFIEPNFAGKIFASSVEDDSVADLLRYDVNELGNGTADIAVDCKNDGIKSVNINLVKTPGDAYGNTFGNDNPPAYGTAVSGNGKGGAGSIRYFSFSGEGPWKTVGFDPADPVMAIFQSTHRLVGARTTEDDWGDWFSELAGTIVAGTFEEAPVENHVVSLEGMVTANTPSGITTGYQGEGDAFIPVSTAKFGQYIGTFGPWNHMDEQNGFFGWVSHSAGADDPIQVYREHANRLKNAGL